MGVLNILLALHVLGLIFCQDNEITQEEQCNKTITDCYDGQYDRFIPKYYTQKNRYPHLRPMYNETIECELSIYNVCLSYTRVDEMEVCQYLKWCESNLNLITPDLNLDPLPDDTVGLSQRILDDLGTLCPYNNYCGRNATLKIEREDKTSCCLDCSCEPDCGLLNSCCFDYMDNHHIVESSQLECYSFNTYAPKSLYMVNRCSDGSHVTTQDELCDTSNVIPVSSASEKRVYINAECARCNNVTSFKTWTSSAICINTIFEKDALARTFIDRCSLQYNPPKEDIEWVSHFICSEIHLKDITISNEVDSLSTKTRICSTLKAAGYLWRDDVYENVYCFGLTNLYYDPYRTCSMFQPPITKRINSLSLLLDYNLIERTLAEWTFADQRTSVSTSMECGDHMIRNPTSVSYII